MSNSQKSFARLQLQRMTAGTYTTGGNGTKARTFHIDVNGDVWIPSRSGRQHSRIMSAARRSMIGTALFYGDAKPTDGRGAAYASR